MGIEHTAFRAVFLRNNPALKPRAGCFHDLLSRVIITGCVVAVLEALDKYGRAEQTCARHLVDRASLTWLTSEVCVLARGFSGIVGQHANVAPVGSGRRNARDRGGRVLAIVDAVASAMVRDSPGHMPGIVYAKAWPSLFMAMHAVLPEDAEEVTPGVLFLVRRHIKQHGFYGKPCSLCRAVFEERATPVSG